MRQSTDMGKNLTGIGMAPLMSERLIEGAESHLPSAEGDSHQIDQVRIEYSTDAPPVGTTPPPATLTGVAKAGMQMLMGRKPTVLMDKLGERLAFERTGTRLYEALISKFDADGSWDGGPARDDLMRFQNQEFSHFELLREAMEFLGGDPTAMTPAADLSAVASEGVIKVVTDPRTTLAESLHAVHIAELVDNDGWEMLIDLVDELGQDQLTGRFRAAMEEENIHLESVRQWLTSHTEQDAKRNV